MREDMPRVRAELINGLKRFFEKAGFSKAIMGLSGGLDSTVTAYLTVEALGKENVYGLMIPYKTSSKDSFIDARDKVASKLGIIENTWTVDITAPVDLYFEKYGGVDADKIRKGNKMARERMSVLYDYAHKIGAIVVGTSNKTECLLGYGTIFGDTACGVNPLGHLYKTQVRQLAEELGVDASIINKPPSADLWEGQTDEDELGLKYEIVDKLLHLVVDKKIPLDELYVMGYTEEYVRRVATMVSKNKFKRFTPTIIIVRINEL